MCISKYDLRNPHGCKLPLRMFEIGRNMNDFENDYSGLRQYIDNSYKGIKPKSSKVINEDNPRFASFIKRMMKACKIEN